MEELNFMRHGHKLSGRDSRVPLEESGLTEEDQHIWQEAVERLSSAEEPELTYENLPLLKEKAAEIYESLPKEGTVIIATTDYPRTRLTGDFLATYLMKIVEEKKEKNIGVAYFFEPKQKEERAREESAINISDIGPVADKIMKRMEILQQQDYSDDKDLEEYLSFPGGSRSHPKENEVVMKAVNEELASDQNMYQPRAELLKRQVKDMQKKFTGENGPLFFYVIGHHSNLIALDVAFNDRKRYESAKDIPEPLELWKVDKEKIMESLKAS